MKTIARPNIAKRLGAICALAVAGALLAGLISPAAAHKRGGGKHGHHGQHQPKSPQNPGPIGPLPKPVPPAPKPAPVVIRDHRVPKPVVVRDHRATPVVRDHRAQPAVRARRGKTTTVKVLGHKVVTVTKGKRCVAGVCF